MLKRIDESQFLIKLLERLSRLLAKQRGLPIVIGVALVTVGLVLQLINVSMDNMVVEIAGIIAHSAGVLIALIGLMLATPLGK